MMGGKIDLDQATILYKDNDAGHYFSKPTYLRRDEATPDFLCHALHYGGGAFEGIRVVPDINTGELFFITLDEHIQRLKRSCEYKKLGEIDVEEVKSDLKDLVRENQSTGFLLTGEGCYLRPIVYRDRKFDERKEQEHGLGVKSLDHRIVMAVMLFPWGAYLEGHPKIMVYEEGVASPLRKHKLCANYGFNGLAKDTAVERGFGEALITDVAEKRNVLEGGGENVFLFKNNEVITPHTDQDILPGTKRAILMEMLRNYGIEVEERKIPLLEFMKGDAAVFTGTAAGVVGIKSVFDWNTKLKHSFDLEHRVNSGLTVPDLEKEYQKLITGDKVDPIHQELQGKIREPL